VDGSNEQMRRSTHLRVPVLVVVQQLPDGQLVILVPSRSLPFILDIVDNVPDEIIGELDTSLDLVEAHGPDLLPVRDGEAGDLGGFIVVAPGEDERRGGARRTQEGGEGCE